MDIVLVGQPDPPADLDAVLIISPPYSPTNASAAPDSSAPSGDRHATAATAVSVTAWPGLKPCLHSANDA